MGTTAWAGDLPSWQLEGSPKSSSTTSPYPAAGGAAAAVAAVAAAASSPAFASPSGGAPYDRPGVTRTAGAAAAVRTPTSTDPSPASAPVATPSSTTGAVGLRPSSRIQHPSVSSYQPHSPTATSAAKAASSAMAGPSPKTDSLSSSGNISANGEDRKRKRTPTPTPTLSHPSSSFTQQPQQQQPEAPSSPHSLSTASLKAASRFLPLDADPRSAFGETLVRRDGGCLDIIQGGLLTEKEARELYELFWSGAARFLPVFDPSYDTFDSLRARSPFAIAAICFVAARVRDGGNANSSLQLRLWGHVRWICQETLFKGTSQIEVVQATVLVAGWSDSAGWLLGGHAVRLAFEVGCQLAFKKLQRSGMGGGGRSREELLNGEDRSLVARARVWFVLYILEHQLSYGAGRPPITREDDTINRVREFLNHPLTLDTDWRVVSTVELLSIRAPLHLELSDCPPDAPFEMETLDRLQRANHQFAAWHDKWDGIFRAKFGNHASFYRDSLGIQRFYAELFHNCTALREVRGPKDVASMPPTQKALAIKALRNAQCCINVCLRCEGYRSAFKYAVHYTHVCAAFAATLLVRLARIFPNELDLRQTARDVEDLAKILDSVPAGRYARSLRLTLRSARKKKVIPPATCPDSPTGAGTSSSSRQQPSKKSRVAQPQPSQQEPTQHFPQPQLHFQPQPHQYQQQAALYPQHQHLHQTPTIAADLPPLLQAKPEPKSSTSPPSIPGGLLSQTLMGASGPGLSIFGGGGAVEGDVTSPGTGADGQGGSENGSATSGGGGTGGVGFDMDFDWSFTEGIMNRAGLTLDRSGEVPLWLSGSDIGSTQLPSAGMENFFLPSELDWRLAAVSGNLGGSGADPLSGSGGSGGGAPLHDDLGGLDGTFGQIW